MIKKIILLGIVLLILPFVNSITYNETIHESGMVILYWEDEGYSGDIWYNNQSELDSALTQQLIELEFSVNQTISEGETEILDIDQLEATIIISEQYLYASEGFNEILSLQTYRENLHRMTLLPNGEINKSSYHPILINDDKVNIGIVQNFIIYGLQLIDNFLVELHNRLTIIENKIQLIEDNGYTGTCPDGQKPEFNQGIMVRCT